MKEEQIMSDSKISNKKLVRLAQLAVLVALIILFSFTGLGYIKVGVIEITLNVIPVAIGAIVLGPVGGAVCGAVFGLTSFIQCFGLSAFGAALLAVSPVRTFITAFVTRVLEGLLTGFIFMGFNNHKSIGCAVSSICCPLLNTILFISTFILLFRNSEFFTNLYSQSGSENIIKFIAWFCGLNGVLEIIACFIIATACSKALLEVNKRLK